VSLRLPRLRKNLGTPPVKVCFRQGCVNFV
jgi:hypothetical protein